MDNITNGTELDFEPYSNRIETYLAPIIFSIIFVTGIVGNWTVCAIFIKHSSMRNVPNTYVQSSDTSVWLIESEIYEDYAKDYSKDVRQTFLRIIYDAPDVSDSRNWLNFNN